MFSPSKKQIDKANKIAKHSRAIAQATVAELAENGHVYARQFRKAYPGLLKSAKSYAEDARGHAQQALAYGKEHAGEWVEEATPYLILAEKKALRLGFLYAIYKLFIADDERVYRATSEAKKCIRKRPVQSAVVALGVGMLISRLM